MTGGGNGGYQSNFLPDSNSTEMFSNTLLSDLGLLGSNGQLIDYYDQPSHALGANGVNGAGAMYGSGSGSSMSGGPSPSDSLDLSFLGINQDGSSNGQDATQALFNQLTAGW